MSASGKLNYRLAPTPPLGLTDLLFINKRLRGGVTKLSIETAEEKAKGREGPAIAILSVVSSQYISQDHRGQRD